MRYGRLLALAMLAACSNRHDRQANIDVTAAAGRAETDIANYTALSRSPPQVGAARRVVKAKRVPSSPATTNLDSNAAAVNTVRQYFDDITAGHYRAARAMWRDGKAPGSLSTYAAANADYRGIAATVGTPRDADAGAGQRYITVPVELAGTSKYGEQVAMTGSMVLHRVAGGISTGTAEAHDWRIERSELFPSHQD